MESLVRLRRGTTARRVSVTIGAHAEDWDPAAVARVIVAFANAVEIGMFGVDHAAVKTDNVQERGEGRWALARWEAVFPKMPPEAFAVLRRMVAASVPGAKRFELCEHAPGATLVVCGFEDETETEATIADVAFRIQLAEARAPRVRLVCHDTVTRAILDRAKTLFETWADVLALGGFRGPNRAAASRATLLDVRRENGQEMVAMFDHLSVAHEGLEALFQALVRLDDLSPIALVEVSRQGCP